MWLCDLGHSLGCVFHVCTEGMLGLGDELILRCPDNEGSQVVINTCQYSTGNILEFCRDIYLVFRSRSREKYVSKR